MLESMNDRTTGVSIANQKLLLQNGHELAYYDSLAGATEDDTSRATLVLLHGYCGSSAYWERIIPQLETGYRIIAPDGRGHGQSGTPQDAVYTMELYAADLAEMLEALKINKAIMLGHSLGGYITLAFAEQYASKLAAFGLIHSTAFPDSEAAKQNRDKAVNTLEQEGVKPFVDALVPKLFAEGSNSEAGKERAKQIGYGTSLHGAQATARGMKARADRTSFIRQSEVPVLLAAGSKDGIVVPEQTFAAAGASSVSIELKEAGHMSMLERPEELAGAIIDFAENIGS